MNILGNLAESTKLLVQCSHEIEQCSVILIAYYIYTYKCSRLDAMQYMHNWECVVSESQVLFLDTYISYLRKKLHIDGFDGIKTVRGIGFQIVAD